MPHTSTRTAMAVLFVLVALPACGTIGAIQGRPGPPVSDATQVAAGESTACAIRARGEVWCWGAIGYGAGGKSPPTALTPRRIPGLRGATQVEVASVGGCAVDETKSLWCWSAAQNDSSAFFVAKRAGVDDVSAVALGSGNSDKCAVAGPDRHVVCWSRYSSRWQPSADLAQVTGVSSLSLVGGGGCAIVDGGRVLCWETDWSARTADDPFPLVVSSIEGIEGATVLESASETTCAALGDRSVRCWTTDDPTPRLVSLPVDGESISLDFGRVCGIAADGVVLCDQFGDAPYEAEPHAGRWAVPDSADAAQVDLGSQFGCLVTSTGQVRCWGVNRDDQLGRGRAGPTASPEAGPVRTS